MQNWSEFLKSKTVSCGGTVIDTTMVTPQEVVKNIAKIILERV
jgi:hypothetical protein